MKKRSPEEIEKEAMHDLKLKINKIWEKECQESKQ